MRIHTLLWTLLLLAACGDDGSARGDAAVDAATLDAGAPAMCAEPFSVPDYGRCNCVQDCTAGAECELERDTGFPGGSCSRVCVGDEDCPDGPCYRRPGDETGLCRRTCSSTVECDDGRWCDPSSGTCLVWCTSDDECLSGHCNVEAHVCDDGPGARTGAPALDPCLRDEDCRSGLCDTEMLGGRCFALCNDDIRVCAEGQTCTILDPEAGLGLCLPICTGPEDCGDGLDCVRVHDPAGERVCFPEPSEPDCSGRAGVVTEGGPCTCASDCFVGAACKFESSSFAPHGICLRACDDMGMDVVTDSPDCGPDQVCHYSFDVPSDDGGGACYPKCSEQSDCAHGRICSLTEGCVPFCQSDDDCFGRACDPYTGWCVFDTPDRGLVGAPCSRGGDCESIECRENEDDTAGFCTARCGVDRQLCPDDAVCVDIGDGNFGACMPACETAADCPAGMGLDCVDTGGGLPRHCDFP